MPTVTPSAPALLQLQVLLIVSKSKFLFLLALTKRLDQKLDMVQN